MSNQHEGVCRLCGDYKPLSFEHIPPRSAFNDRQRLFQTMQDMLSGRNYSRFRRGIGRYSLCVVCNSLTGGWYGTAFAHWTEQGMSWLDKIEGQGILEIPFYIQPLNVLKQALTMALAVGAESTLSYHHELRMFVLNKERRYLPPKYKVHVYFNGTGQPRFAANMVIMNVASGASSYIEAEVALPPFGYCITTNVKADRSLAEQEGLYDISWFARYDYNIWTPVYLRLPIKETHEPLPLDYRTKEEVDKHMGGG